MFKRIQWLGGAGLVLAGGVSTAFFHQRAVNAERVARSEALRAGQMADSVAELRREVHAIQAQGVLGDERSAAPSPVLASVVVNGSPAATPSAPTSEPAPPPKVPTTEEMRDGLNVHFYEEAVDTSWSETTRRQLQTRVSGLLPAGSKLVSMECRSTMCRAEVAHPDLEAHREFIRAGFSSPAEMWRIATNVSLGEPADSAKVTSIVFLSREGRELPYDIDGP